MKQFGLLLNEEIEKYGEVRAFPAGTILMRENSAVRSIPFVLKGSLKVMRTETDGREVLLYYIKPGESCIMSFLDGMNAEMSKIKVEVEEESEVLMIPIEKANNWVKEFPEWTSFIFKLYHQRFEELLDVVNELVFHKLDDRIMHLLKQKAIVHKTQQLNITHQQLADELGTTREVVSRILKQLEKTGVLELSRNKISLM